MELEPSTTEFQPIYDPRPKLLPPPPVQLVSIADVNLRAVVGVEKELDAFYIGLLRMEREPALEAPGHLIVYRTENFRLRMEIVERPGPREDFRPLGVTVPSLADISKRLTDDGIEFVRQRGLWAGMDSLLLNDPAGNPVELIATGTTI